MTECTRMLFQCPDQPGIIAAATGALAGAGHTIHSLDEHVSADEFFMRAEFSPGKREEVESLLSPLAEEFSGQLRVSDASPKKTVVMFSREHHCLVDLLWRSREGDLPIETVGLLSNHQDREEEWQRWAPFSFVPVNAEEEAVAEEEQIEQIREWKPDLVVFARYMRIVSGNFLQAVRREGAEVVNIHHSFLPAFPGAAPYTQAWEKGVKMIGATAHLVTPDLDAGPIIAQSATDVSHRDTPENMQLRGQDLERVVLARAVRALAEDRVLLSGNRTIVF